MDKRKIILDCDPGHDDAVAITLAGINEKIDLLAAHGLEGVADLRGLLRIVVMGGRVNQFSSSSTAVSSQWSFFGHFEQSLQIFCGNSSFSTVRNPSRWKKCAR